MDRPTLRSQLAQDARRFLQVLLIKQSARPAEPASPFVLQPTIFPEHWKIRLRLHRRL